MKAERGSAAERRELKLTSRLKANRDRPSLDNLEGG